jgi:hypothetical protein
LLVKVDDFGAVPAYVQISDTTNPEEQPEPLELLDLDPETFPSYQFSFAESILLAIMVGAIILSAIIVAKNYVLKRGEEEKR